MPSVLIPKYSLGQISTNYFKKGGSTTVASFVSQNFTDANGSISAANPQKVINQVTNDQLNAIISDYGNGTISKGLVSLDLINRNVISGTQSTGDIFNNSIIYGASTNFKLVTSDQGRTIILGNLGMLQIINLAPVTLQSSFYNIADSMVIDLKNGVFKSATYSIQLTRICKQIAQAVSRVVNATNL